MMATYPECIGWKDASNKCRARAKNADKFCRHHTYQHAYAEFERPEIAQIIATERKHNKLLQFEELQRNRRLNSEANKYRKCWKCHVYNHTEFDVERAVFHCKHH